MTYRDLEKKNKNKFGNSKKKKLIALITAAVMAVSGLAVGLNSCKRDEEGTSTSIAGDATEEETKDLILTEDFDINNESEVKKRAEEIYNISDKEVSVSDIMNIIYLYNGVYDKVNCGGTTDIEKYQNVQKLAITITYKLLSSGNLDDMANRAADLASNVKNPRNAKEGKYIYAYMFESSSKYKDIGLDIANNTEKQIDNILLGDVSAFENSEKTFENTISDLVDASKSSSIPVGYSAINFLDTNSKEVLYPSNSFDSNYSYYTDDVVAQWAKTWGIDINKLLEEGKIVKTSEYSKYINDDAKKAKSKENTTQKANDVQKGGKHVANQTSSDNYYTTTQSSSTTVHEVPEEESKKAETTTQKQGGQPVGEPSVSENTTHVITEEDVKPGEEESYSAETYSEETCTFGYVDANISNGYSKTLR